jgi:ABC-type transport system substrate-binding protein
VPWEDELSFLLRNGRRAAVVVCVAAIAGLTVLAGGPAGAAAPKFDPNGVLKVGDAQLQSPPTHLDPRVSSNPYDESWMSAMYAPLMRYDATTNKYSPYLAKSVTVVDPRTVKVELRADAKFDTGAPITAADAKATIETARNNQKAGRAQGLNAGLQLIDNVEVTGPTTFTIHLNADGLGVIYDLLVDRNTLIVPATAGASQDTKPVTTGPFRFVSFSQGQSIVVEKSPTFFDAKSVHLKGMQFLNLLPGTAQTNALLAGDVQYSEDIGVDGYKAVLGRFNTEHLTSEVYISLDMCKLSSNFFGDLRVRQALAYGTDRAALAKIVFQGLSQPAYEQIPPGDPRFNPTLAKEYTYNLKKAKALLGQAGVKDGTTINVIASPQLPPVPPMVLVLKDQWAKLGLNLNIVPTTDLVGAWTTPVVRSQPPGTTTAALTQTSPLGLQKLTRNFATNGVTNACNYQNAQLNQLMNQLSGIAPTDPQFAAKWKQIQQIAVGDDVAMIPMAFIPLLRGWSKTVGYVGTVNPLAYRVGRHVNWESMFLKASK